MRVEGIASHPANGSAVGARAISSLQTLYDADRIEGPLVREGGTLVPTTWERALGTLADKLVDLRRRGAPERLLVLTGREDGVAHELLARLCRAFGTPNLVDARPNRSSVLAQATEATTGTFEVPVFEWPRAAYVLALEAGVLEDSCATTFVSRALVTARSESAGRHARLVHAGPAFDLTASVADEWIRIAPGSSGALALGIAGMLVREGLHDEAFVKDHASGFDAFRRWLVDEFPLERAAKLTGAPPNRIATLARELASRRPSFVFADERTFGFSNGWETALAVLACNALLGAVGPLVRFPGRPPYAEWPEVELDEVARLALSRPRIDRAGTDAFPRARAVHETIPEAIAAGTSPEIVVIDHANPLYACAQPSRWRSALASVPFVVCISPFRDETVEGAAHLVLPDRTFLEHWENATGGALAVPVAGVRRPVIEPLLDARATGDVLLDLAHRLGDPVARALPWRSSREALDARLRGLFEAKRGSIVEATETAFLARLFEVGFWTDAGAPPRVPERFEFQAAFSEPRWEGDAGAFPLGLIVMTPLADPHGSGANQPWLRRLRPRPGTPAAVTVASIHPESAPGVRHGDEIEITSPFGTIVAVARLDERMLPGYVVLPTGGGHAAFGRWAAGRGANAMDLISPAPAPRTGANARSTTRVRVARRPR